MKMSLGKELLPKVKHNYINQIREPVVAHREIEARKFQTRIDYVDLSAFGVGVKFSDEDKNKAQLQQTQDLIDKLCNKYGVFVQYLEDLDKIVDVVMQQVCCMALRYDERMAMILDQTRYDSFQRDFVARVYQNEDYTKKKKRFLQKRTLVKFKPAAADPENEI